MTGQLLDGQALPEAVRCGLSDVHPSWRNSVMLGLQAVHAADPAYLSGLKEGEFLPDGGRLFSAFSLPLSAVNYVLVGEGPYPRAESANGVCFMDGAVRELWSDAVQGGLSKKVNRATSLRNFIKMLLVAEGLLDGGNTMGEAMVAVSAHARQLDSKVIQSLPELQKNLTDRGFLLLNASLVYRPEVAPRIDARAWQPFLQIIFSALNQTQGHPPRKSVILVLWGKIAEMLKQIPASSYFPHVTAEHPYNLSFINNQLMQDFFRPMHLLIRD
jgi:uracil-DNA glycosylase